uniref:Uncharacterized protein n=1 Tax=Lotharella globosa TaxID=91324 RepID=A0A6V3MLL3_9EUKA|mmetsp:Transcript_9976/g.19697  ORF Transcript_9976/g.19697 Transcript_9976/m.19697 type:complete len:386 (+) Transcript_9976:131-1288(+)
MKQEQMLFIGFLGLFGAFIYGFLYQDSLPDPPPKIIGIDLGTTFSCVGAFQAGSGERLIFRPEENKTTIPSIIAFTTQGILVGRAARRQAETNPHNTLWDAKRFIGRTFTGEEMEALQKLYPFTLVRRSNGSVHFMVEHAEGTPYGTVPPEEEGLPTLKGEGVRLIAPEEVGAVIIDQLRKVAQKEVTTALRPVEIKRCVISVPADFNTAQRNATRWAAELAGMEVMRIVSEPTAAAMAYGVDREPGTSLVLVVDLGGGTLDVSLLRKRNGKFWVLGMAGDNRLGGQDFNRRLRRYALSKIEEKRGKPLTAPGDLERLSEECERVKLSLSVSQTETVQFNITGEGDFSFGITRGDFEDVNRELFKKVTTGQSQTPPEHPPHYQKS